MKMSIENENVNRKMKMSIEKWKCQLKNENVNWKMKMSIEILVKNPLGVGHSQWPNHFTKATARNSSSQQSQKFKVELFCNYAVGGPRNTDCDSH